MRQRPRLAATFAALLAGATWTAVGGHAPSGAHTCVRVGTTVTTISVFPPCSVHDTGTHACVPVGDGTGVVVCIDPPY
jgi:hypothetical protein